MWNNNARTNEELILPIVGSVVDSGCSFNDFLFDALSSRLTCLKSTVKTPNKFFVYLRKVLKV